MCIAAWPQENRSEFTRAGCHLCSKYMAKMLMTPGLKMFISRCSQSCERRLPLPWGVLGHCSLPHRKPEFNASKCIIATQTATEWKKASKVFNAGKRAVSWHLLCETENPLISKGLKKKKDLC